jgi:hypothetical protein
MRTTGKKNPTVAADIGIESGREERTSPPAHLK